MTRQQAEQFRTIHGPSKRTFTPAEIRRMFKAREDNIPEKEIARRFRISTDKLKRLIGPKVSP